MVTTAPAPAPDVVALVVNYRTPTLTIQCVRSLLRSRDATVDVVVIDNASGDDSVARVREAFAGEPRVTVVARDVNDGYAGGNNAGVSLVRSLGARWALVLNSDAEVDVDCVRRLVDEGVRDGRIALVSPRIHFGDARERLWFGGGRFSPWTGRPVHVGFRQGAAHGFRSARDLAFATGCALLVRLDAVPGDPFDASLFSYAEDLDLSLRLRRDGWRVRYAPDAVVWHHEGSSHRKAGGEGLRFYLNTRNLLRVVARHTRWYHWITLGPSLLVNVVGRSVVAALLAGDRAAARAVVRGAWHAIVGGRHTIETSCLTGVVATRASSPAMHRQGERIERI
jgi:GT2 family glycosyltransferase